ncbi:MAG: HEPN domain-containing protein [Bacteroidales bacterium]|nr:HEPN domain-containing protein [Bacteroidales bacterium]
MIKYRLDFARKYLDDAVELFNQKRYNSSASMAYYASYQAMWAGLDEPRAFGGQTPALETALFLEDSQ